MPRTRADSKSTYIHEESHRAAPRAREPLGYISWRCDGFGRACVAAVGAERGATIGASRAGTEPVERHAEQHCERARSLDSKDRVIKYKDALDNTH